MPYLKRVVAILFLGIMLCASTEAYQLLKLPLLVVHYLEHKADDANMDFSGFLSMHYSDDIEIDEDWQDDMQLPFKQCSCLQLHIQPVIQPDQLHINHPEAGELLITYIPVLPNLHSTDGYAKIFQPPRHNFSKG